VIREASVAIIRDDSTLPALIEVTPLRCGARLVLRDGGDPATAEVRVSADDRAEVLLESAGTRIAAEFGWTVVGDRVVLEGTVEGRPFRYDLAAEPATGPTESGEPFDPLERAAVLSDPTDAGPDDAPDDGLDPAARALRARWAGTPVVWPAMDDPQHCARCAAVMLMGFVEGPAGILAATAEFAADCGGSCA
jgi:hypothetical protein